MITVRAKYDGKVFIPESPVDLPPNRSVNLHVEGTEDAATSPPGELLKLLSALPPIPQEDLDESERHIREGQAPTDLRGAFDD